MCGFGIPGDGGGREWEYIPCRYRGERFYSRETQRWWLDDNVQPKWQLRLYVCDEACFKVDQVRSSQVIKVKYRAAPLWEECHTQLLPTKPSDSQLSALEGTEMNVLINGCIVNTGAERGNGLKRFLACFETSYWLVARFKGRLWVSVHASGQIEQIWWARRKQAWEGFSIAELGMQKQSYSPYSTSCSAVWGNPKPGTLVMQIG